MLHALPQPNFEMIECLAGAESQSPNLGEARDVSSHPARPWFRQPGPGRWRSGSAGLLRPLARTCIFAISRACASEAAWACLGLPAWPRFPPEAASGGPAKRKYGLQWQQRISKRSCCRLSVWSVSLDRLSKLPSITISAVVNRHMSTCLLVKLAESMPGTARLRVLCSSGLSAKSEFHGWLQRAGMSQNVTIVHSKWQALTRTWKSLPLL